MVTTTPAAIDRTIDLDVNGSRQRVRLCADAAGRPPLLIVQTGPGLPLLNEARKYRRTSRTRDADVYGCSSALTNSRSSWLFKSDTAQNDIPWWTQW